MSASAAESRVRPAMTPERRGWLGIAGSLAFLVLVFGVFFFRGKLVGPLTGSLLIPFGAFTVAGVLVARIAWVRGLLILAPPLPMAFALVSMINVLANAAIFPVHTSVTVRFAGELALNLLVYYVGMVYGRIDAQAVARVAKALMMASLPLIIAIAILAERVSRIRRIGGSAQVGTAVNHLAHALAITIIGAAFILVRSEERRLTRLSAGAVVLLAGIAVILAASRASAAALVVVGLAGAALTFRRSKAAVIVGIAGGIVALVVFVGLWGDKIAPLVNRFSWEYLTDAVALRGRVMLEAFQSVRDRDMLIGVPWRYEPIARVEKVPYPHNFVLAILIHLGVIPAMLFTYYLASRMWRLARACFSSVVSREGFVLGSMLFVAVAYVSTSGQLTRVLTIFLILGLADGWLFRRRHPRQPERGGAEGGIR